MTNRPIWSDTPLLGMLFVVSAASISAALMILLAREIQMDYARSSQTCTASDAWVIALEFIVLIALMVSLGPVFRAWLSAWGLLLFFGVVVVGMLLRWRFIGAAGLGDELEHDRRSGPARRFHSSPGHRLLGRRSMT